MWPRFAARSIVVTTGGNAYFVNANIILSVGDRDQFAESEIAFTDASIGHTSPVVACV